MEKLKPCPFCGGEATAYADNYHKIAVICNGCGVKLGIKLECGVELIDGWTAEFEDLDAAIEAWNRRVKNDRTN